MSDDMSLNDKYPQIDLRSDTVTRPTQAMYERMQTAPIGDDGLDGDPTAIALEELVASTLGKESGLFVPSCTMANLLAVLSQTQRQEQLALEATAHMYTSERGSATFTGLFYQGVEGVSGAMSLPLLEETLSGTRSKIRTGLVAMETSHNNAGGIVLPLAHMQAVHMLAQRHGALVHVDGARFFNASVFLGVSPVEIAQHADTVSICLSKGLSAPVGALLVGERQTIAKARAIRRMLGGSQRQIGIMAAAGIEAIEHMTGRLIDDHSRARRLSDGLNRLNPGIAASDPDTNIVQVEVGMSGRDSEYWVGALARGGILTRPWGKTRLRCVTHRHIGDAQVDRAVEVFRDTLSATH
jgi:threonine aldolase